MKMSLEDYSDLWGEASVQLILVAREFKSLRFFVRNSELLIQYLQINDIK